MEDIVVLHIGYAGGDKTAGVSVSIPEYLRFQALNCNCALMNLANIQYGEFTCFLYDKYKNICELPGLFKTPSIVIFHELYRIPFLNLYRECIKRHIPYVIIHHGGLTKKAQNIKRLKKIIGNIFLFNRYIKNATYIQFLSEQEKENSIWNKHNNFVLGNGIHIPNIGVEKLKKKEKFELLFIGRYDIYFKGLDVLLEAVLKIKSFMIENNMILRLYGKGVEKDRIFIEEYIRKNDLMQVVSYNGPIFSEEKIKKYCEASIFIQTSRSEGQPMGILEAMSCYLPLIVTPGTTMATTVKEHDLGYVTELDADSVGKVIIEAYKNKDKLPELAINARNYVDNNFDGNCIAKKAIQTYQKIIAGDI